MKRYVLIFILTPITCLVMAQAKPREFRIAGRIVGLEDNSVVAMSDANKPSDTIARAVVKMGEFFLAGQVAEPNLFVLNFLSAQKKATVFIGNDNVQVSGDVDNLAGIKVNGSASEKDFLVFENTFNPLFAQINQISQMAGTVSGAAKKDSLSFAYQTQSMLIQSKVDSFIRDHNSSYVSPFLLVVVNQLSDDVFLLERRYQSLSPIVQQSMYGKYLQGQIEDRKVGAIGTEAMDFSQADTSGRIITLSSLKGKYVLVDFWASWCKPCRMENPNVLAAYEKFKNKNFTVLGVSLDQSKSSWVKAINDDKLVWYQVSDLKYWNNDVARQYKIQQIPQNILVDPNGKIVGKNLRGVELDSRLCALLGCN
jgi:peroxiredoxin